MCSLSSTVKTPSLNLASMATILSLPPELLLDIFEIASSSLYPPMFFCSRAIQLSHLSVVHSRFTDPARSLMVQDIRVGHSARIDTILSSSPWNQFTARYLKLDGRPGVKVFSSPSELRFFTSLVSLYCLGGAIDLTILTHIESTLSVHCSRRAASFDLFFDTVLIALQTLYLYDVEVLRSATSTCVFPSLRRLTLGGLVPDKFPSILKNPASMPNVRRFLLLGQARIVLPPRL
jgi:hypothetical protein